MRNHQQCPPEDATIATLNRATLYKRNKLWRDEAEDAYLSTDQLIRYGATFWKPIEPEPGYRLLTDEERVGEKSLKNARYLREDGEWRSLHEMEPLGSDLTYAVPIEKQVVAWIMPNDLDDVHFLARFLNQEDRDHAVRESNERER